MGERERECKVGWEWGRKEGINGGKKREQRKEETEGGRIGEDSKMGMGREGMERWEEEKKSYLIGKVSLDCLVL